jgi:CBS domain-containing protein
MVRTVDEIMKINGHAEWYVKQGSSVKNAIRLMVDKQVSALPVLEAGKLVGIISDDDCIQKVILKGKPTEETQVEHVMARNMIYVTPAQTIEDCLSVMIEKHIQQLPVIAEGSLVGLVSMSDLFRTIITDQKDYICRLENYIQGIGYM